MKNQFKLFINFFKLLFKKNEHELLTPNPKKEPETELDYNPRVHKKTNRRKKNHPQQKPLF